MKQYFNFARLIKKYGKEITVNVSTEGYYNNMGEWEAIDPEPVKLFGAAINHRESKIFRAEGKLTGDDKALYMLEPLKNALHGAQVVVDDKVYSIGDELQNGEFTGVWAYTLKFVSAFKKARPNYDVTDEAYYLEDRLDGVYVPPIEPTPETTLTEKAEMLDKRLDGVLDDTL